MANQPEGAQGSLPLSEQKKVTSNPQAGAVTKSPHQQPGTMATFSNPMLVDVAKKAQQLVDLGMIHLPKDYSLQNAIKGAELILADMTDNNGVSILSQVTPQSVGGALFRMITLGLNPLKKQCSFLKYGNKLVCQEEYAGNISLAKRFGNMRDIKANAVYQDDEFDFEVDPLTGRTRILKHKQTLTSIDINKLAGAYAVVTFEDGTTDATVMSMAEIRMAWNQGPMKGNSPAHKNFPGEMSKKTAINRAIKLLVRASDDGNILPGGEENDNTEEVKPTFNEMKKELKEIAITASEVVEEKSSTPQVATEVTTEPKPEKPF